MPCFFCRYFALRQRIMQEELFYWLCYETAYKFIFCNAAVLRSLFGRGRAGTDRYLQR